MVWDVNVSSEMNFREDKQNKSSPIFSTLTADQNRLSWNFERSDDLSSTVLVMGRKRQRLFLLDLKEDKQTSDLSDMNVYSISFTSVGEKGRGTKKKQTEESQRVSLPFRIQRNKDIFLYRFLHS